MLELSIMVAIIVTPLSRNSAIRHSQTRRPKIKTITRYPLNIPPVAEENQWSRPVIVETNFDNVYQIMYFQGVDSGWWQEPDFFEPGEEILRWMIKPE